MKKIIYIHIKYQKNDDMKMSTLIGSFKNIFHNNIPKDLIKCGF